MDLQRSEDQELLRDTTRRFLEDTAPVPTVREWAEKEPAGYPTDWWQRGAELGWTSMLVPEELGGGSVSGHGLLDLVLVAEELGRLVSPGPFLPTNVVAFALATGGTPSQHETVLPALMSGEQTAAWCTPGLFPPAFAPGPDGPIGVTANATTDGFELSGRTDPVEAASHADYLLVAANVGGSPTQFLVPADAPGVSVTPVGCIDLTRRAAVVRFDKVHVSPDALVGEVGEGAEPIERQLQIAVALQCAEMVGAIEAMFRQTLEYSFDRYSFGRPLASYQALKHRFADMALWLEACHATATGAARAASAGDDRAAEYVSVAKSYIGDRAPVILQDCVQLQGGIGVTWDHDLHLYLRRVQLLRSLLGTPEDHRARIAAGMGLVGR